MKAVVIGESSGASMEAIMAVYPRHKAVVDKFVSRGVVLGIGPFTDGGNMAIFKTRADAEAFSKEDPFILEGVVKSFASKDWRDSLLPELSAATRPPAPRPRSCSRGVRAKRPAPSWRPDRAHRRTR